MGALERSAGAYDSVLGTFSGRNRGPRPLGNFQAKAWRSRLSMPTSASVDDFLSGYLHMICILYVFLAFLTVSDSAIPTDSPL